MQNQGGHHAADKVALWKSYPRPDRLALNWEASELLIPGAQAPQDGVRLLPLAAVARVRPGALHGRDVCCHTSSTALQNVLRVAIKRFVS